MNIEKMDNLINISKRNPILRNIIYYLFFPITVPIVLLGKMVLKKLIFSYLDKAIETKNENAIIKNCSAWLKSKAIRNKWKAKISKKWFLNSMAKVETKLYEYAVKDREKMSFKMFRTLLDVYMKYDIIGGGMMNIDSDTVIKIED